jgi:hypothetical protein
MNVVGYVYRIVEINEIALIDLPECYEGSKRQKKVNQQDLFVS